MKFSPKRAYKVFGFSLAAAALLTVGTEALAQSINGNITFDGSATVLDGSGAKLSSNLSTAAALDFKPNNYQEVTTTSGDFSTFVNLAYNVDPILNLPDLVAFNNFTFYPNLNPSPVDPLWTVDGFSFELTSIAIDTRDAGLLSLIGAGILTGNGFDATDSIFNFTSQNGDGSSWELSFSAGTYATGHSGPDGGPIIPGGPLFPTPLPGAIFFVMPALAGLFGWSRRKNSTG